MKTFRAKPKKLRELVLHIAKRSDTDENFGMTKLNKILFACDFFAYKDFSEPITGQKYQKLQFGPTPRGITTAIAWLEENDACVIYRRERYGYKQRRVVPMREPDLSVFSPEEVALVDDIIEQMRDSTGSELSEWSHLFVGWQAAEHGEDIPYETVFVGRPRPLTEGEIQHFQQVAEERAAEELQDNHQVASL